MKYKKHIIYFTCKKNNNTLSLSRLPSLIFIFFQLMYSMLCFLFQQNDRHRRRRVALPLLHTEKTKSARQTKSTKRTTQMLTMTWHLFSIQDAAQYSIHTRKTVSPNNICLFFMKLKNTLYMQLSH